MAKIFLSGQDNELIDHALQIADCGLEGLAQQETERLAYIFDAASAILPRLHSFDGTSIARTFTNSALTYRAIMLNTPILLEEDFAYDKEMGIFKYTPDTTPDFDLAISRKNTGTRKFDISFFVIGGKTNYRMFNTGAFGFMTVEDRKQKFACVIPTIALPKEFSKILARDEHKDLVDAFTHMSDIINHDWLHSIVVGTINSQITPRHAEAPAHKITSRISNHYFAKFNSTNAVKARISANSDWFENYHMRFQRDLLTHMAQQDGNPLEKAVDEYMKAWKNLKRATCMNPYMKDPAFMMPARFALKMLAFNLVRAVPYDHPIVQKIVNDKEVGNDRIVIDKMYQSLMTGILFGHGKSKKRLTDELSMRAKSTEDNTRLTSKLYSASVGHLVSNSLELAHDDAVEALGQDVAIPRANRHTKKRMPKTA